MDINITLVGEFITFGILLLVVIFYLWPPLIKKIEERQGQILQGIQNFEKSNNCLAEAKQQAEAIIHEAKTQAVLILDQARKQAEITCNETIRALEEQQKQLIAEAKKEAEFKIEKVVKKTRDNEVEYLIAMLEKILERKLTDHLRNELLDQTIENVK